MMTYLAHLFRGLLMGGADVIPGVSGGTVALIVGIYEKLVAAISHFDLTLLAHLRRRQWRAGAAHVDLGFLVALGCGMAIGIVSLGGLMNELLTGQATRPLTLAAFFGMIVASSVVVARSVQWRNARDLSVCLALGIVGAAIAIGVTCLPRAAMEPTYGYLFLCGMVAICAMILPGISGAYILLLLGVYVQMTDILKALPRGEITAESVLTVGVFAAGCAIGLLSFSKILRWLLTTRHSATMAVLCGFMIGALGKVWPLQKDLTPEVESLKHKEYHNVLPQAFDAQVFGVIGVGLIALVLVFVLDACGRRLKKGVARDQNDDARPEPPGDDGQ